MTFDKYYFSHIYGKTMFKCCETSVKKCCYFERQFPLVHRFQIKNSKFNFFPIYKRCIIVQLNNFNNVFTQGVVFNYLPLGDILKMVDYAVEFLKQDISIFK